MSVFGPVPRSAIGSVFGGGAFSPRSLFRAGEQGVWYDPSDLTTLYQDTAGTTPVTAAGQSVALMLDKSRGLALGPELVTNGDFSDGTTGWAGNGGATVSNVSGALRISAASNGQWANTSIATTAGRSYKVTFTLLTLSVTLSTDFFVGSSLGGTQNGVANYTSTGTKTFFFTATAATTFLGMNVKAASAYIEIDNISVRELPGNHATQSVLAARPIYRVDANGRPYLEFDGTDDSMATSAINFTATDAVSVFAGVRKASDTARGTITELTASVAANNGGFHLTAPNAASDTFAFESKGTALTDAVATGIAAPATRILSGLADISADSNILRVNGAQADADTGDQGTGNYANAILYVGRRASTSLPFNGQLYGLIVRGAASSDAQIRNAEAWLARRTGVVI